MDPAAAGSVSLYRDPIRTIGFPSAAKDGGSPGSFDTLAAGVVGKAASSLPAPGKLVITEKPSRAGPPCT